MKKIILILSVIVLISLIFAGCSKKEVTEHNYTYQGENELWNAEYRVNGTATFSKIDDTLNYESEVKNDLFVTYKGELTDLSTIKHMEISYECGSHSGSMVNDYAEGDGITSKTFTLNFGGNNARIPSEKDTVKVTIDVDGETQNLELKSN